MAREHFDQELRELKNNVVRLGSMVRVMIEGAAKALVDRDPEQSRLIVSRDSEVDALAFQIEDEAVTMISRQQPVASDLRRITAAVVIVHELERMGDHAEGIAKINRRLCKEPPLKPLVDIPRMAEQSAEMLRLCLQAYVDEDEELARQVWEMDDTIDALYDQVYRELLTYMMSDPHTIERATRLLHVAHDFERVGDRVTNICERIVYITSGKIAYVRRTVEPGVV